MGLQHTTGRELAWRTQVLLWRLSVTLVTGIGVFVLWLASPVATVVILVVAAGLTGAGLVAHGALADPPRLVSVRNVAPNAARWASVFTGLVGLATADERLCLGLILVGAVTSPRILRWCGRGLHRHTAERPRRSPRGLIGLPEETVTTDPTGSAPLAATLAGFTDAQLCRAWRRSYLTLIDTEPDRRLEVVEMRAACLNEMARRHPREIQAWLIEGGRAQSGPERYLA